jgi:FkbM family methyltransferase
MCAKLSQALDRMIPGGPLRDGFKSLYYRFYYNRKHIKENGFRVHYNNGSYEYAFDGGVSFLSRWEIADELKRSLGGYLAHYAPSPGDTVIDCGACKGEFSLYASKAVGASGRVLAFEPDPRLYAELTDNIALNGSVNITAVKKGVWSSDGELKFVDDDLKGHSFMKALDDPDAITVPVASIDGECARLGIKKVDFIKMDVEGAEIEAIRGAELMLRGNDAAIAVASYHLVDGKKSCDAVERALEGLGYKAWTGHPRHVTTYGKRGGAA